jgi:hypothetical protein
MLFLIGLALGLLAASILLLPFAIRHVEILRRYSGSRLVACPENQQAVAVGIDARLAADSAIDGTPQLRVCECTRWPEHAQCAQQCLEQALHTEPYREGAAKAGAKPIYHLPVLLAAFAAWCLGAIWHAPYLFRHRWLAAVGLTQAEVKQMVWWLSPHLLTAAVCLLFAYGVAWLLVLAHRKGALAGVLMALLLGAAVAAVTGFGLARMPHELLVIESGYAVLATVTVGAIVGGLSGRLAMAAKPRG